MPSHTQVEEFIGISGALLVNMGTLSSDWVASKKLAAARVSEWIRAPCTASGMHMCCVQAALQLLSCK
jgi:hydroxyethylthiazole kinase